MSQEILEQQTAADLPQDYFEHARDEMLAFLPEKADSFLEVGCGGGTFGNLVKAKYNCEYWGIELNPVAARVAETRLDRVFLGGAPETIYALPERRFDCIVFNDVLEHLVDPYKVLREIKKYLNPGGSVVASIPNVRHFETMCKLVFGKTWRYQDAGILDRTHLRFFTEITTREFFEEQGYRIDKMAGINRSTSRFEHLVNLMTLGWLRDTLFLQFGVRAVPQDL